MMPSWNRPKVAIVVVMLAMAAGLATLYRSSAATTCGLNAHSGDLNCDGSVNITDLSYLLSRYAGTDLSADANGDGKVDVVDLSIVLTNFGTSVGASGLAHEAESFALGGLTSAKAVTGASGGSAVQFSNNATITKTIKLERPADRVALRLKGDQCEGAPAYTLTIDRQPVASGSAANADWTDSLHSTFLEAGTHVVEISFTNFHFVWLSCMRQLYVDKVSFSASGAALPSNPPIAAGFARQSGTQIVDGAGRPLRLRGVNFGGWVLWEGWIWGQGFDYIGETDMLSNLAGLVGRARAEQFREDVRANYVTDKDFEALSHYGFNFARVGFNHLILEDDDKPFVYKPEGWALLDRTIASAKKHNVYLNIEMHGAPCSQGRAFVFDYVTGDDLWGSQQCQDRAVALWRAIADRYKNENVILGFDLLGEPIIHDAILVNFYKRLTAAIREVDRNHILIYEGSNMGRDFGLFTVPLDSNQVLSFHDYPWMIWGESPAVRFPKYDAEAKRLNSPMYGGEWGQGTYENIELYISLYNQYAATVPAWTQWTWKQSPGFAALQNIQHTPLSKKTIDWMNNTTRAKPTLDEAEQGMDDFINAIKFENTVHDAKMRAIMTKQ